MLSRAAQCDVAQGKTGQRSTGPFRAELDKELGRAAQSKAELLIAEQGRGAQGNVG